MIYEPSDSFSHDPTADIGIVCCGGAQKLSYTGGSYMNGHFSQVYPGQAMVGANALMPMYPFYHFHQSQTMGHPAHMFPPTTVGPMPTVPAIISKPASMAPNTGTHIRFGVYLIHINLCSQTRNRNHTFTCDGVGPTVNWAFADTVVQL